MEYRGRGLLCPKGRILFVLGLVALLVIPFVFRQMQVHDGLINSSLLLSNFDGFQEHEQSEQGPARKAVKETRMSDGTFNGFPIYFNEGLQPHHSTVHCIGDNHQENAWMYRSCEFRHLCFDVDLKKFVIYRSPVEKELSERITKRKDAFVSVSTLANVSVAVGAINPRWNDDRTRLRWFPRIEEKPLAKGFYELPSDVVLVPFHSLAGFNAGHLMWDDFLPIHTLLSIFGFEEKRLMLMRYIPRQHLWATCEFEPLKNGPRCNSMFKKFLPALGVDPSTFRTTNNSQLSVIQPRKSNLVCANVGAAGIGMIQDHGLKLHGWLAEDYKETYNMGRGGPFYRFRNFMVENLGLSTAPLGSSPPFNITFSTHSSSAFFRRKGFEVHSKAAKDYFKDEVRAASFVMSELSLYEQARITVETAIYVTVCGGGAVTATFLPRGASLILYYDEKGTINDHHPARLDWDLLNNVYIRTHWMPLKTSDDKADIDVFVNIIANDLDAIKRQR